MKLFDRDLDGVLKNDVRNPRQVEKEVSDKLIWMPTSSSSPISYEEHEKRMVAGWRAPTCKEYFNLLYGHEEASLDEHGQIVVANMSVYEEFVNCAVKLIGSRLDVYEMVSGLQFKQSTPKYVNINAGWYESINVFDVSELELNESIPLEEIESKLPSLVKLFYGRAFDDLPDIAKDAKIFIPGLPGHILMASVGGKRSFYDLNLGTYKAYSRGVLPK